jgi:tricarballylate dehydrogenase
VEQLPDVLVIGGGNAALCAAITARRAGARVLLLESASRAERGGNSRHTRNVRYAHERASGYLTGSYGEDEFWDDLRRVTGGETDEVLARLAIRESRDLGTWIPEHGVPWQAPLRGTLHLSATNAFFLGGGKALINAYYDTAQKLGVEIEYGSEVRELEMRDGRFLAARVASEAGTREIRARAVVAASGGFEANLEWLREYWGDAAANFAVRGTPHNKGRVLRALLDQGVRPVGNPREFHAVAVDARGPGFDGGIVTRLDAIPFGIAVNKHAQRFHDEGEDLWPKRYAIWGGLIARQPDQLAYSIVDAKQATHFMPSLFPPIRADSLGELARALDLPAAPLEQTVREFNLCVRPGSFDPSRLDDCRTEGLDPPKSHWALPLEVPPFLAYPLRPGITFTYLGVAVTERAQVVMNDGQPASNIFAAGEIMAGNILGRGYLAGFGMTIGTTFGRIAGREAARDAGA